MQDIKFPFFITMSFWSGIKQGSQYIHLAWKCVSRSTELLLYPFNEAVLYVNTYKIINYVLKKTFRTLISFKLFVQTKKGVCKKPFRNIPDSSSQVLTLKAMIIRNSENSQTYSRHFVFVFIGESWDWTLCYANK